ncbi:MAG: NTP transferase domain-containing protein [Gammaproteobacteria bacterium]|nr:NTP transferase domain-containing protein [Gammaproteobacteria bacterium]MBU1442450.1 NTP transferase domain-containing protein [Gammaproteobacteria bacterium]MBU2287756.1 NTP transferase domain-containing protein [Gammaproteobacteria bacterium]
MILAAGRGQRMRPLTDRVPKPLLDVRGKPLMEWPLDALAAGGFTDCVINTDWLGEQIGQRYAARPGISFSHEGQDFGGALETAGGIVRALPMLGEIFWVVAGDVFAPDFAFTQDAVRRFAASGHLAHLWLVANPAHNLKGDFGLSAEGLALNSAPVMHTFSTYALYRAALFSAPYCQIPCGNPAGIKLALAPLLRAAIKDARVGAELYVGAWTDVGTPERLAALNDPLR